MQASRVSYSLESEIGEGHYRTLLVTTSEDFFNPEGSSEESLGALSLSFDQELGDLLGVWIRFGWARDDAAVYWESLYSGGINIMGNSWQRSDDNIGIGYVYLEGGNMGIDNSQVFETYYRYALNEHFATTADIQYMKDCMNDASNSDGWIFGVRLTVEM